MMDEDISRELRDQLITVARRMRAEPTLAEKELWEQLRRKKLGGYRFRQQHIIHQFIVDFCCLKRKLIVEVDGEIHDKQKAYDAFRDDLFYDLGFRVLHFQNSEVLNHLPKVLYSIRAACDQPLPLPLPLERGRGGATRRRGRG